MAADTKKTSNPNPFLKTNSFSKFFFWWLIDIIRYGRKHDFVAKDLYDANPEDLSEPLTYILELNWNKEVVGARKQKKQPSLWKVVIKTYCWDLIKLAIIPTCFVAVQLVLPELLFQIISYFHSLQPITPLRTYFNAITFFMLIMLRTVFFAHSCFHLGRLGMQARIACTSLIYKKLIRLPASTNQNMRSSGISLLSVDVARFESLFSNAPFIVIVPVQVLIATYLISKHVDFFAAAVGIALLILLTFPLQAIYTKMTLKLRSKQAARTDCRIALISEIITGIQVVKMYAWEKPLEKLVSSSRKLSTFAISMVYILQHGIITVNQILPITNHLSNVRANIMFGFFYGLKSIIDMSVSMHRIEDFLLLEEVRLCVEDADKDESKIISIQNVTAFWNEKLVVLKDISLDFKPRGLYAIVGSIGSGKSSILKLILGELQTSSGRIFVHEKVSYSSQEPWLFNGSIRDNILFGEIYDEEKYEKTIDACALTEDFSQLLYGDLTLVGERGSNLSGGQRARVNLARAVYRDAEIYLLDDPLSAVDGNVGKKIMQDCINGLLKDKTRILVTHGVQKLEGVTEIILLEFGEVKFKGSINEFCRSNQLMAKLVTNGSDKTEENVIKLENDNLESKKHARIDSHNEPKETEELIAKGSIKSFVYLDYLRAGGLNLGVLVILTNCLFVVAISLFDYGLAVWSNEEQNRTEYISTTLIEDTVKQNFSYNERIMFIFGGLIMLAISSSILKYLFLNRFALNAGRNIHKDIFSRLMRTTLRFFNSNSTGKILNRFSEDVRVLDNVLPSVLSITINATFHSIAILSSIIIANWLILIPFSALMFATIIISKLCLTTIQKIRRVAGIAKSPILSFAASSLEGVTTIRACRAEPIVNKIFDTRQDQRTSAEFSILALDQAFTMWVELMFTGLFAFMIYLFLVMKDEVHGGIVGLTLMQISIMTETVPYVMVRIVEVFANMISVERMLQFKELEQEKLIEDKPAAELPRFWPDKGDIVFKQLYLRYIDESEPALWNIGCHIKSGTKVGIVGRTGAGKSSLISALFQFATTDGSIVIDGVDIKKVDLYRLRSKISVIPQEPILFQTSLRKNLDPLDKFSDAALYSALESVQLKKVFDSLDFPIERSGSNLSVGQRQLLCLARAIVSKNKILVLDEATANVDSLTDAIIQKTIRMEFKECTVLTVAHRLDTVMDSDKIMVMDGGRLVEYDHPFLLLQNKESYLFKMAKSSGEVTVENFKAVAKQAYENLKLTDEVCDRDQV